MGTRMATTVHLDASLLDWLDREAARCGVRRNRLISMILAREMNAKEDWPPNLFPELVNSAMSEKEK